MYENESSALVKMYLEGKLGRSPDDTNAYAAATFFAVDRYVSYVTDWKEFYKQPDTVIIASRYTTANAVHQLAKIEREKWDEYLTWLTDFEHVKLGLPRADLVLYLEMKPEISFELIKKRTEQTGQQPDIHETDKDYLFRCYKSALYSSDKLGWTRICCYEGNAPLSCEEIQGKIAERVTLLLDVGVAN